MIKKIKEIIENIKKEFNPKYTSTKYDLESEQCYLYQIYRNDKCVSSVKLAYYSENRIEELRILGEKIQRGNIKL